VGAVKKSMAAMASRWFLKGEPALTGVSRRGPLRQAAGDTGLGDFGFRRSGDRVAKTPVSAHFGSLRGWTCSTSRSPWWEPGDDPNLIADFHAMESRR